MPKRLKKKRVVFVSLPSTISFISFNLRLLLLLSSHELFLWVTHSSGETVLTVWRNSTYLDFPVWDPRLSRNPWNLHPTVSKYISRTLDGLSTRESMRTRESRDKKTFTHFPSLSWPPRFLGPLWKKEKSPSMNGIFTSLANWEHWYKKKKCISLSIGAGRPRFA